MYALFFTFISGYDSASFIAIDQELTGFLKFLPSRLSSMCTMNFRI